MAKVEIKILLANSKTSIILSLHPYSSKLKNRIRQRFHVCCQGVGCDVGKSMKGGEKPIEGAWKVKCYIGIRILEIFDML